MMNPTLELKELTCNIGRLFMAGMPGPELDTGTEKLIRDLGLGGVILFSRNIQDPEQVTHLCRQLQERALAWHGIPLFLAVDQEGGRVARLKEPFTVFPGNAAIGEDPDAAGMALEFAEVTSREMTLVGLNMNLAPVVDVPRGQPERHLVGRTFGTDAERVGRLGATVIQGLQENGIICVAKHFPGLGRTPLDPHHELPVIAADLEELESIDLPPFRAAVEAGVCGIMSSHAVYPALDADHPATLSHRVLTGTLRERLGFEGVVITDDLEMGAVAGTWGVSEGAVLSFKAGADILLICENQDHLVRAIDLLRKEVMLGSISEERLHRSLQRIEKVKEGYLKGRPLPRPHDVRAYFEGSVSA